MGITIIEEAFNTLGNAFDGLNWDIQKQQQENRKEIISHWPGDQEEDIMVCVLKSRHFHEPFHRQDFFFLNYAYQSAYHAESASQNHIITIPQDGCYIGQPYSGYALLGNARVHEPEIIIVGILIKRKAFLKEYLPVLSSNATMLDFFIESQKNARSDAFLQVNFEKDPTIRSLIEMFVTEYAFRQDNTQNILKSMFMTLLIKFERLYRLAHTGDYSAKTIQDMRHYISDHLDTVSLKTMAEYFSYHPNYLSAYLHHETGKTFSEILLQQRMERAGILLERTQLSIPDISHMVGYNDLSNFYKAFRKYYHVSPGERRTDPVS